MYFVIGASLHSDIGVWFSCGYFTKKKGWMVGPVQQAVKGTGRDDWYLLYFPLLYNADPLAFFAVAKVIFLGHVYLCNSYYFFILIYPIPHSFKRLVLGQ